MSESRGESHKMTPADIGIVVGFGAMVVGSLFFINYIDNKALARRKAQLEPQIEALTDIFIENPVLARLLELSSNPIVLETALERSRAFLN